MAEDDTGATAMQVSSSQEQQVVPGSTDTPQGEQVVPDAEPTTTPSKELSAGDAVGSTTPIAEGTVQDGATDAGNATTTEGEAADQTSAADTSAATTGAVIDADGDTALADAARSEDDDEELRITGEKQPEGRAADPAGGESAVRSGSEAAATPEIHMRESGADSPPQTPQPDARMKSVEEVDTPQSQVSQRSGVDDDDESGFTRPKEVDLQSQLMLDADDDSLTRWKLALVGGNISRDDDDRRVVIEKLWISSPGRENIVYEMDTPEKVEAMSKTPYVIKEKSTIQTHVQFRVRHDVVYGLKQSTVVSKMGIKVNKEITMLGSFAPTPEPHTFAFPPEDMPGGMLARGHYTCKNRFYDDDGNVYLNHQFSFYLKKKWPDGS